MTRTVDLHETNDGTLILTDGDRAWCGIPLDGDGMRADARAILGGHADGWIVGAVMPAAEADLGHPETVLVATCDGERVEMHGHPGRAAREYLAIDGSLDNEEAEEDDMIGLTDTERSEMIDAVALALEHAYQYGQMVGVCEDDVTIGVDVQPSAHGDYIVMLNNPCDVLGDSWSEGLPQDEGRPIANGRWTRDMTPEIRSALRDGATWWTDRYGAEALAESRARW